MMPIAQPTRHILLADDDKDDRTLFNQVLEELPMLTQLEAVHNGERLMQRLYEERAQLPDVLFLDLNMPRKNGAQCLKEIRKKESLQHLPVIVLSTTSSEDIVDAMYQSGANLYIQKPSDFKMWKRAIAKVLNMDWNIHAPFSVKENFTLTEF